MTEYSIQGGSWNLTMTDDAGEYPIRATRITLHQGPSTPEFRDMTRHGWDESFVKLDTIFEGAAT